MTLADPAAARPVRLQRRRCRGWRMPANTRYVGRPSKWGNPFVIGQEIPDDAFPNVMPFQHREVQTLNDLQPVNAVLDAEHAVALYREWLGHQPSLLGAARRELAGHDLACWCPVTGCDGRRVPCHADVLLAAANPPPAARLAEVIAAGRFRHGAEAELQEGLADAFAVAGLWARREVRLSPADVIDFMVGDVGVEVKVAGPVASVTRQLARYAAHDQVAELLLVTTRSTHRAVPPVIGSTPVRVVWLSGRVG